MRTASDRLFLFKPDDNASTTAMLVWAPTAAAAAHTLLTAYGTDCEDHRIYEIPATTLAVPVPYTEDLLLQLLETGLAVPCVGRGCSTGKD